MFKRLKLAVVLFVAVGTVGLSAFAQEFFRSSSTYTMSNSVVRITNASPHGMFFLMSGAVLGSAASTNVMVFDRIRGTDTFEVDRFDFTNVTAFSGCPGSIYAFIQDDVLSISNSNEEIEYTVTVDLGAYR